MITEFDMRILCSASSFSSNSWRLEEGIMPIPLDSILN